MKKLRLKMLCLLAIISVSTYALPVTKEVNGIWYSIDSNTMTADVTQPLNGGNTYYSGMVNIPSTITYEGKTYTVTAILNGAFRGQGNMTTIVIPKTVKYIDYEACQYCSNLQSIVFASNGVLEKIERRAFTGCSVTALNFPNSLISIGEDAFKDCDKLKSIKGGDNIQVWGDNIFQGCISLTEVTFPKSLKKLGDFAFWNCSSLKKVTMNEGLEFIGNDAFLQCQVLEDVTISNTVKEIGWEAFRWCINLKHIEIPNSVEKMDYGVFRYCTWLESVKLSDNLTEIPGWAFEQTPLKSIELPKNIKKIMPFAFRGCLYLTDVKWGNSLELIGGSAFANTGFTRVELPEPLFEIGQEAFAGCENLMEVIIPRTTMQIVDLAFAECRNLSCIYNYSSTPQPISWAQSPFIFTATPLYVHVYNGLKELYETNISWEQAIEKDGVIIVDDIPVVEATSIVIENAPYYCGIGEVGQAVASTMPKNAFVKDLSWSSSDESILHIEEMTGQFVGLDEGEVTITVSTTDGTNLEATAKVYVTAQSGIKTPVDMTNQSRTVYNLQGQKMSKPVKGINIINGKKYIIK